ncbi:hypothetical protein GGG17_03230 [Arsenicicoccus sp. MKL-02]|uniref:Glycine transporter domain-containing protein n=1 Tax=Arsenicicoccus cauae TaxID=2663847 RepID=A0A6I3IM21_9MICO|nr:hypothetical protein [Arsenicicoccus cauae]
MNRRSPWSRPPLPDARGEPLRGRRCRSSFHERLDPVGFAVLAILSGLGGGMIRDTLLQGGPPVALTDTW